MPEPARVPSVSPGQSQGKGLSSIVPTGTCTQIPTWFLLWASVSPSEHKEFYLPVLSFEESMLLLIPHPGSTAHSVLRWTLTGHPPAFSPEMTGSRWLLPGLEAIALELPLPP